MYQKLSDLLKNTGDMALKRRAINIIKGLDVKEEDKILDVGCGDGYYLHILTNLGVKLDLTGTDSDQKGLEKAQKNLGEEVGLVRGDLMSKLPFPSNYFDKVIMSEVAEHLPHDVKGLKEIRRVMKKKGILCLTVPNHNYPLFWDPINWLLEHLFKTYIKSGFFAGLWNQHKRLYTPQEIKKVVEKSGFNVSTVKSLTWWCLPFNHYLVNIVARGLAAGTFSKDIKNSLNKFSQKKKKPFIFRLGFDIINFIDKLNDVYQPNNNGVSVFIKAFKQ